MSDTLPPAQPTGRPRASVPLEHPIRRGETEIREILVRKPGAGELRGLSLQAIGQMDVNAVLTILPRITEPPLTAQEVEALEVEDLSNLAGVVLDFFLPAATREKIKTLLGT